MHKSHITFEKLLTKVEKPTRYLGNELNVVIKEWTPGRLKVALAFPDTYEIGMSHMGTRILYKLLNDKDNCLAERVYMPWIDMRNLLREHNVPLLALESWQPLRKFDVVGFSLQYEMEYTNILDMLHLGGIPVFAREREDAHPLVIAGGPVAFNPEPMADFIDIFVIGDGEESFPFFVDECLRLQRLGQSKSDILSHFAALDGFYVPARLATVQKDGFEVLSDNQPYPVPVKRHMVEDINAYPFPSDFVVPYGKIIHDRISVELSRGCTQGCRFCQAGIIYRPERERDPQQLTETIIDAIEKTGYDEVSLTSLSSADYTGIELLAEHLMDRLDESNTALAFSSMRVYGLSKALTRQIARARKTGFTIAPEAGSQRMRDIINKNISEADIVAGVTNAFQQGWTLVKLYLMIGLPNETDEDAVAIVDLAEKILKIGRQIIGNRAKVNVSVNTFVPKPHTPFQWSPLIDRETVARRQNLILDRVRRNKSIVVSFNDYDLTELEVILSRGDRAVGKLIHHAWQNGAILDAWFDQFQPDIWYRSIEALKIETDRYLNAIDTDSRLPWEVIDTRVEKRFLLREFHRAMTEKTSVPCEQPVIAGIGEKTVNILNNQKYVCYSCGLECDLKAIQKEQKTNIHKLQTALEEWDHSPAAAGKPDTEAKFHYLVTFSKKEAMRYIGHLDLQRLMIHTFRRLQIPIATSQGFRPKPKIWFTAPLGLGIGGENEILGFSTPMSIDPVDILQRMNAILPPGIVWKDCREVGLNEAKQSRIASSATYHFVVAGDANQGVEDLVSDILQKEEIWVTRKKGDRRVNVRSFLHDLTYDDTRKEIIAHCDYTVDGTIRPDQLVQQFSEKEIAVNRIFRQSITYENIFY
jgi:radical SAM family uncharacterized protein/radical SAM-linked protein